MKRARQERRIARAKEKKKRGRIEMMQHRKSVQAMNFVLPSRKTYDESVPELLDDGTLDTVIRFRGQVVRFSDTADYRDYDGDLDIDRLIQDNFDIFYS